MIRETATARLAKAGFRSAASLYDAAIDVTPGPSDDGRRSGSELAFPDGEDEPWPDPIAGVDLVLDLVTTFARHIALPHGGATALALWTLHAHAIDAADISPRLAVTSPSKRCGKTLVLTVLESLVPRALPAANVTAAVLFRIIEKEAPTLLVDEADSFLPDREELRGVLNTGFARGGRVLRCVGDDFEARAFRCFAPVAIASIGGLPGTVEDRSILIKMKRKTAAESVLPFRRRDRTSLRDLRRRCARWALDSVGALREAEPVTPAELNDRAADKWEPLFAIADRIGGPWPERSRKAALVLSGDEEAAETNDLGVALLGDIRSFLVGERENRMASETLLTALVAMEGRRWAEIDHGRPLTQHRLAKLLAAFEVTPKMQRIGDGKPRRGYERTAFEDAFARYLPKESATGATAAEAEGESGVLEPQPEGAVADSDSALSQQDDEYVAGVAVPGSPEDDGTQDPDGR